MTTESRRAGRSAVQANPPPRETDGLIVGDPPTADTQGVRQGWVCPRCGASTFNERSPNQWWCELAQGGCDRGLEHPLLLWRLGADKVPVEAIVSPKLILRFDAHMAQGRTFDEAWTRLREDEKLSLPDAVKTLVEERVAKARFGSGLTPDMIVARAAADESTVFEQATIEKLRNLAREDRAGYQRLRSRLKKRFVKVSELDKFVGIDHAPSTNGAGGAESGAQAEVLLRLAKDAELWHTEENEAYATIAVGDHRESHRIASRAFKAWLRRQYWGEKGKSPGADRLQEALGVLEARALYDGPTMGVHVRLARHGDAIWIDRGDRDWSAIQVTTDGWRIVRGDLPVKFRRPPGVRPLPEPIPDGSLSMLRPFLNVGRDEHFILMVAWLIAAFQPEGPYPILVVEGPQGAAKSTNCNILKRLVDPSSLELRQPPHDQNELIIQAANSWTLAYDNVSDIPPWFADALCRLATGGGHSKRQLYTDSDEVILNAKRPVILNGIAGLVERPDLEDRTIGVTLGLVSESERRTERDLWAAFDAVSGQVLGAVLKALSKALKNAATTTLDKKPRMADFATWVVAAEDALVGTPVSKSKEDEPSRLWEAGDFLAAYEAEREEAIEAVLQANEVAFAVKMLADAAPKDGWAGTMGDLLEALKAHAFPQGIPKVLPKAWPKSARGLTGILKRFHTTLLMNRVKVTWGTHGREGNQVEITKAAADYKDRKQDPQKGGQQQQLPPKVPEQPSQRSQPSPTGEKTGEGSGERSPTATPQRSQPSPNVHTAPTGGGEGRERRERSAGTFGAPAGDETGLADAISKMGRSRIPRPRPPSHELRVAVLNAIRGHHDQELGATPYDKIQEDPKVVEIASDTNDIAGAVEHLLDEGIVEEPLLGRLRLREAGA